MSSPPPHPGAGDTASQPIFPDEILTEIFLRLDSAADLARTSAACTAFLRVVRFLRRNRPLYRQLVVGFLECEGLTDFLPRSFYHAEPPHRSASAARALAKAADFSCSFLPEPGSWGVIDAAGGRLLLSSDDASDYEFEDLVVCDPLNRRYVRIPRVPADLAAGTFTPRAHLHLGFFAPTGEEEASSFRVIWMIFDFKEIKMAALVFSSATSQWRGVTVDGWKMSEPYFNVVHTSCRYHPKISIYNSSRLFSEALMLDTHKMEFSVVRTPLVRHGKQHAIVEAGEGRLGFLTIGDGMVDFSCKAWQDNRVVEEWQHGRTISIPLPDSNGYSISFCGTGDGFLLIQAIPPDSAELQQKPEIHYFTLHVKTLLVERLCMLNEDVYDAHLYTNFLPPLSLPTV